MNRFDNLPKGIISLIVDLVQALKQKNVGNSNARFLPQAIEDAMELPNVPKQNLVISFKHEDTWLNIIMADYKIEISDSFSDNGESYTRFEFRYEINGYRNEEGNIDELRCLLFDCLRDVSVNAISFSQEE